MVKLLSLNFHYLVFVNWRKDVHETDSWIHYIVQVTLASQYLMVVTSLVHAIQFVLGGYPAIINGRMRYICSNFDIKLRLH